jgi:hypothetical protein
VRDAYDEDGHALPRGIVQPELGFPQDFAEVMVGELPLTPTSGRIPKSLSEVNRRRDRARSGLAQIKR